ncbi:hypothetical protein BMT71_06955, partial [Escherichia coli]
GTVCVVGKIRDLILQLSKSSIYSTKPFIGYAPAMFCFSLYGYILDLNPGIIGYKIVFGIMACFAFSGAVVSVMLVKRISQRKKEMLAAEA